MKDKTVASKITIVIIAIISFFIAYRLTGLKFMEQMLVIMGALLLAFLLTIKFREKGFFKKYAGIISLMVLIVVLSLGYSVVHNVYLIEIIVYLSALLLAWLTSMLFSSEKKGEKK